LSSAALMLTLVFAQRPTFQSTSAQRSRSKNSVPAPLPTARDFLFIQRWVSGSRKGS